MNIGTVMVLGIMVGIMIAAWALTRKKMKKETEYDEMQLKIRTNGYQIAFFTALGLQLVLILLLEANLLTVVTPGFAAFAALLLSVTVFAVYCIMHDAFLAVDGHPGIYIGIFGMVIAAEAIITIRNLINGTLLENGKLTIGSGMPLVMLVCFLVILVTLIAKTVSNGKGADK